MKLHASSASRISASSHPAERGTALMLSLMVLFVIGMIVYQISIVTSRDSQVASNDITLTQMDLAIESCFLEAYEWLSDDLAAAGAGAEDPGLGGEEGPVAPPTEGGDGADAGAGEDSPVDSKMDSWATPQATNMGDLSLRFLVQDEDSKYNVLNLLVEDEEAADEAYDRVVRILDFCRDGTAADIDAGDAEEMVRVMRDHFMERSNSNLPRAMLLSDDEEEPDRGMPLSLRELVVIEPFQEQHFRDYFDVDGQRVHSIESFLTVYTSVVLGGDDVQPDGYAVNVNTAPAAVLSGLMDDRDVDRRFWDGVIEYRNEEEEPEDGEEEVEPALDEFGEEILQRKFFDNLEELDEVYDWALLEVGVQDDLEALLKTSSNVFSIYVTARLPTQEESSQIADFRNRREQEEYERSGTNIVRTARSVVWRRESEDGAEIIPLVRWQILDYAPLEVRDYPDEDY